MKALHDGGAALRLMRDHEPSAAPSAAVLLALVDEALGERDLRARAAVVRRAAFEARRLARKLSRLGSDIEASARFVESNPEIAERLGREVT